MRKANIAGRFSDHLRLAQFPASRRATTFCSPRNFDRYFELQLSSDVVSESDFAFFLRSTPDPAALEEAVNDLKGRGLQAALAQRIDDSVGRLPLEHPDQLLALMFDNGADLDRESEDLFNDLLFPAGAPLMLIFDASTFQVAIR